MAVCDGRTGARHAGVTQPPCGLQVSHKEILCKTIASRAFVVSSVCVIGIYIEYSLWVTDPYDLEEDSHNRPPTDKFHVVR